ncbi:spore coat protein [Bacillus canaveralius]|uniref:Spore coat protein n=1 Tax=Bacillus canaveralius TaxID=1403243 RepID=A0A2N5GP86_9BACI|nr:MULTISPECIES: spore coat protein [Bacillus]PLR84386.1 spore coat protein [Bacillus canaveralius]PLR87031.1 spore coat protein [Bacillus sp. V33-4]PLS00612.1 spore coat protein [Bacillus canaveralius]RSK57899.1 spore coat protein [Bacillus canaveralius]
MNEFMQNVTGTDGMTDQVIATDLLIAAKTGVKSYAIALTESANPEVRQVLRGQLDDALELHERISAYMISNQYYHPANVVEQLNIDLTAARTALQFTENK